MPELLPLIVNVFGGPCSGKSTQAAGLFYKLKVAGYNTELITEKAKDLTWEENHVALANQLYVTGSQIYRQERVENKVDIVVTDSPFLMGTYYWISRNAEIDDAYNKLLVGIFKSKNNYNIFLNRPDSYNSVGRNQGFEEAKKIDQAIQTVLKNNNIPYDTHYATPTGLDVLFKSVLFEYKNRVDRFNAEHYHP